MTPAAAPPPPNSSEEVASPPVSGANGLGPKRPHLGESVRLDHWLRLLVVVTTSLVLLGALYVAVLLLALVHHTVLLFALGGLFAYALDPIVEFVRGNTPARRAPSTPAAAPRFFRQRPRWLGVSAVFVILIGLGGLATFLLGNEMAHQARVLARDRTKIEARGRHELARADAWLAERGVPLSLVETLDNPPDNVRSWGEALATGALNVVQHVSSFAVEGAVVLIITAYFLLYSEEMRKNVDQALPERIRPYATFWQDDVNHILGGFVRGQAVLALVLGASAAVVCAALGLRLWLLIGLFVVLASLIPVVGPYIGAIPALVSAIVTPDGPLLHPLVRVVLVSLLFFVINEFGSKVLYPRLVGKALGLHEVLVLLVLLAGFEVGGIVGVLFAAPITALAIVTAVHLWRLWHGDAPLSLADAAQTAGERAKKKGVP